MKKKVFNTSRTLTYRSVCLSFIAVLAIAIVISLVVTPSAFAKTSIKYGWAAVDSKGQMVLGGVQYPLSGVNGVRPIKKITNGLSTVDVKDEAVVYLRNKQTGKAQALVLGDFISGYKDAFITSFTIVEKTTTTTTNNNNKSTTSTKVVQPVNIASLNPSVANAFYTGKKMEPKVTIKNGAYVLKKGIDYDLKYDNNVNVGTANVTIIGKGRYTGTKKLCCKILRPISKVTIDKIPKRYISTPNAKTPSFRVFYGKTVLKKGIDYTLKYKNNTKAGTAKVIVWGKGNYSGHKTFKFELAAVPSKLNMKNKKILVLGDSIQANANYGKFIISACTSLGMNVKNADSRAVSGATLSLVKADNNLIKQINGVKSLGQYDYYFIAAGVNDASRKVAVGTKTSTDTRTIQGSLNTMIRKITSAHMKARGYEPTIIVITPIGCNKPNRSQSTLKLYRKVITSTSSQYANVTVINGLKLASTAEMNSSKYTKDKLHPKYSFGSKTIANRLAKQLNANRSKICAYQLP